MDKPWYEKVSIWITIIAGIFGILGISIFGDKSLVKDNNTEVSSEYNNQESNEVQPRPSGEKESNLQSDIKDNIPISDNSEEEQSDSYNEENNDSNLSKTSKNMEYISSENTNNQSAEGVLIDVNTEVKGIRTKYYNFQENKGEPIQSEKVPDITIYHDLNNMVSLHIPNNYMDISYSRIYYFDENGKLYFSFIFNKRAENRLYFKNDTLIRYIDENGNIYDLGDTLDSNECGWAELALEESYEILNSIS